MQDDLFINHILHHQIGSDESTRCYVNISKKTGYGEVIIEKTISKRMPLSRIQKAEDIFQKLTDTTGGLRCFDIDDLLEHVGR